MADKYVIHGLNTLLQDLCQNQESFRGKLVVFGGDFGQVLPVVRGGGRTKQVEASIVTSPLWEHFIKLKLSINMRARSDPGFADFLMRIGNGEEPMNSMNEIQIPKPMFIRYTTMEESIEEFIKYVYPDMDLFERNLFEMMQRVIFCPKNEFVDDINSKLNKRIRGEEKVYIGDDRANSVMDQGDYIEYLNSLEPRELSQHRLVLKKNSAVITTGQYKGKHGWIPRIQLEPNPSNNKYLIPFVKRQLPLRLCFAMTINKSQGQTLDCVGIYLRQPIFTHGQLYVALSRARTGDKVKLLIVPPTCNDPGTEYTTNVVYNEVLLKTSCI
ncbi:hypothetical protein LIER_13841 [Lithospermum erythrorhizon]|uniref:ATP-dependent DNA helicase n=1 Tax=Lithospermum erythrorhizon TaxID=34254 RepID=A0AAV3Q128_LITER